MVERRHLGLAASRTSRRIMRVAVGAAAVVGLLLAFWWMAGRFIAQPRQATLTQPTPVGVAFSGELAVEADEIVEVPYGETVVLDDLTRGMKYDYEASSYLQDEWEKMTEAERQECRESEDWDFERAPFSARVVGCAMVSPSAFAEWYPLYPELDHSGVLFAEEDERIVVVDVEVENLGPEAIAPPDPILKSAAFLGPYTMFNTGMFPDNAVQAALYPLEGEEAPAALGGGYNQVMPGERRVISYAFRIFRNSFAEEDGIDGADLSNMEISYVDYHPRRIIALKLANAHDAARAGVRNAYLDGIRSGEPAS